MTLFVDASAIVAMIADEPENAMFVAQIEADPDPIWSAMACWEAVSSLRHSHGFTIDDARTEVQATGQLVPLRLVSIGRDELDVALDAYARFGKGRHPAALNMGDCFAYACAKANQARLLYKGDDFSRTDLA